jgi:hypothetical protein
VYAAAEKNQSSKRHAQKQFDLMVKPAAIIKESDRGNQCRSGHNSEAL